jgi:hypothetical protein
MPTLMLGWLQLTRLVEFGLETEGGAARTS